MRTTSMLLESKPTYSLFSTNRTAKESILYE
jgi:hypothetical protein